MHNLSAEPAGAQVDMTWSGHVHVYGELGCLLRFACMHCPRTFMLRNWRAAQSQTVQLVITDLD